MMMTRSKNDMQEKTADVHTRKFSLSNINGLLLIGAVLAGTILTTGAAEVRFRMSDAKHTTSASEMKVSQAAPGVNQTNSVVR